MEEELQNLKDSVKKEDAELIKHYAHKMKGAAANMMVEDLRGYCHQLQDADKSDKEVVNSLVINIESSFKEFKNLF